MVAENDAAAAWEESLRSAEVAAGNLTEARQSGNLPAASVSSPAPIQSRESLLRVGLPLASEAAPVCEPTCSSPILLHDEGASCSSDSIALRWSHNHLAASLIYELQFREYSQSNRKPEWQTASSTLTNPHCRKRRLDSGKAYQFRVRARRGSEAVPWGALPRLPAMRSLE